MAEYSVGDEPWHSADGVVGDVVIPHHVERVGAGFAVRCDAQNVRITGDVGAGLVTGHIFRFIERDEVGLSTHRPGS